MGGTCSILASTISTKEVINSDSTNTENSTSEISNTESTQVISSSIHNDTTKTETKCLDNTINLDIKNSNNKNRKNDPPKSIIEVKKKSPFDDIRMGLKSVKKTPKTIAPKPAETES